MEKKYLVGLIIQTLVAAVATPANKARWPRDRRHDAANVEFGKRNIMGLNPIRASLQ